MGNGTLNCKSVTYLLALPSSYFGLNLIVVSQNSKARAREGRVKRRVLFVFVFLFFFDKM